MATTVYSRAPKPDKRQRSIADAVTATRKLKRPPSITAAVWRGVHAVLIELSRHIPDPFPSEARLAQRTGYSLASVERYIKAAEKAGLIKVESFRHGRTWNRNRYHLTWLPASLCAPQSEGLCAPQFEGLTPPPLRGGSDHTFGVNSEPPSAAIAAAGPPHSNPLDEQPTWYPGWNPTQKLDLPPDTVWRRNLYATKCALCVRLVPPQKGWVTSSVTGRTWLVVHDSVCPKFLEGGRPGRRIMTAGEIGEEIREQRRQRGLPQGSALGREGGA